MAEANTAEVEAKVDAAFGAAFGGTPPAPAEKVVADPPVAEPAKPAAATPAPVPEKPQYVRLTKQEWDNTKAAAGKVATLESRVAKFEGSLPKTEQIVQQAIEAIRAQTPIGAKVTVTPEDFAELGADFEELSGMTMKGLQRVLDRFNVAGTAPASPAKPVDIGAEVEKVLLTREEKALTKAHPKWKDIVGQVNVSAGDEIPKDNPFRQWATTLPAEEQEELNETQSPAVVQTFIERFIAQTKPASASPSPKPDKAAARRAVIEDAVTPRADGNPPPLNPPQSADDAFATGFKVARKH